MFDILSGWFSMFWWFNATVIEYWKHLLSLFFGFIVALLFNTHSGDFMYDFPLLNLFYEKYKTIDQHFQIQNNFLFSMISLLFGNYLRKN